MIKALGLSLFIALALPVLAGLPAGKQQIRSGKWQTLFTGTLSDHWRGYKRDGFPDKGWRIENGVVNTIKGGDQVDLITREKFRDFDFEVEWKVGPKGNSGIIYLVSEDEPQSYMTGPEMQILDDDGHRDGLNVNTSAGALYALVAPKNKVLNPAGQWNKSRLMKVNNHVEHWLNGRKILEYELGSEALKQAIAASKFKAWSKFATNSEGFIALQFHGEEAWFRNARVRRITVK